MHAFAEWLGSTPLSIAIQSRLWLTPLLQTIHITMIGIVFVSMLMVALRVLGQVRTDEPLAEVWHRFAPWFWTALGVMLGTGLILTIGEPVRQASALSFWLKMTLIIVGVTGASAGSVYSSRARVVAVATIVLWLVIIFLGRSIAYDVEIWESWHLA
jgi:hypothetical protein